MITSDKCRLNPQLGDPTYSPLTDQHTGGFREPRRAVSTTTGGPRLAD